MSAPGWGPPPTGPARQRPLPVMALVGVIAVALGGGIPLGIWVSGSVSALTAGTTSSTTPVAAPPRAAESPAPAPLTDAPSSTSSAVVAPSGLSPTQSALRDRMSMYGVDPSSCRPYPDGEQVTPGVVASIQCDITDPSFTEPITYYQFSGAAAVSQYFQLRQDEVDRVGTCADGAEQYPGPWTSGGVELGSIICVDNIKYGTTYFKVAWSFSADSTVAVIQGVSPSATYQWWYEH